MFESAQQITQKCVVDKRRVCACTICGRSIFLRRSHLHSHDTKQLATGFSNKGVTTRMAASTNMFLKMHLLRSARGGHAIEIVAPPAARASQGIIPSHSRSVGHPSALREPSAASLSRYRGSSGRASGRHRACEGSSSSTCRCSDRRLTHRPAGREHSHHRKELLFKYQLFFLVPRVGH